MSLSSILNLIPGFQTVKVAAITGLVTFVIGSMSGWHLHTIVDVKEKQEALHRTLKIDAKNAAEARKADEKIAGKTREIAKQTESAVYELGETIPATRVEYVTPAKPAVKRSVLRRIIPAVFKPQEPAAPVAAQPAIAPVVETAQSCGPGVLSVYDVGLLNHALDPAAPDPAGWGDAEKRTPSENGLREVSQHLAKVAGQYRDLAVRHDALVDFVDKREKQIQDWREKVF